MACSQTLNGIAAACETNVGGIREVYIANYDDVTAIEVDAKQETVKRMEIAKLSLGELRVIVKDANGKYWFLGYEEFVSATAGTAETGVNRTDGNRYTITLTDYSSSYPYEVDASIVDALVA